MSGVYVLAWFPMLVLAIINGAVREKLYGPRMSERSAHQLSCLSGIILFTLYTAGLNTVVPLESDGQAVRVGVLWLAMTMAFEFFMVCCLQKKPFSAALDDYDITAGRMWPFVLLAVAVLPWLVHRFG